MKRLIAALVCLMLVMATGVGFAQDKKFGLEDIPEIQNKRALTLILETGEGYSKVLPAIERFTEKTGVKVNVERDCILRRIR